MSADELVSDYNPARHDELDQGYPRTLRRTDLYVCAKPRETLDHLSNEIWR